MSEIVDSGTHSVRTAANPPDKSTFSQTRSLLSQYLKEKGSLGDLNLGIMSTAGLSNATTMNLFPAVKKSSRNVNAHTLNSMKFFPRQTGLASGPVKQERPKKPESAQMTIFYGGQVMVFDDFPADKVREIVLLASKGNAQVPNTFSTDLIQQPSDPTYLVAANPCIQVQPPVISDLPMARKASLARFLAKRNDRIAAHAPYQTGNSSAGAGGAASKPAESKSLLGLFAQSPLLPESSVSLTK